jgi:hypothetical protein
MTAPAARMNATTRARSIGTLLLRDAPHVPMQRTYALDYHQASREGEATSHGRRRPSPCAWHPVRRCVRLTIDHRTSRPSASADITRSGPVSHGVCGVFRKWTRSMRTHETPPSGIGHSVVGVGLWRDHNFGCREDEALDCCARRRCADARRPGHDCHCGRVGAARAASAMR